MTTEMIQTKHTLHAPFFSIKFKFLALLTVISLSSLTITGVLGIHTTNTMIQQASETNLKSMMSVGRQLMENQYSGNWAITAGKLWKGDTVINGNPNIAKALSIEIGDAVTIYQNNAPISTSMQKQSDGPGIAMLPTAIKQRVLNHGKPFIGPQTIAGQPYEVAFEPIMNAANHPIGVWSLASPLSNLTQKKATYERQIVLISIIVLLVAFATGWLLTSRMTSPLNRFISLAWEIGNGNLSAEVTVNTRDEIGQLGEVFRNMTLSLRGLIQEVTDASIQLATSSEEFASSAEETNYHAGQVSVSIEDTARLAVIQEEHAQGAIASIELMSQGVRKIAEDSHQVSTAALHTSSVAANGQESVNSAVRQFHTMESQIHDLSRLIHTLGQKSQDIDKIVKFMTEVASQTNLLAINAAIEAARAGESGRGFSVVASEIRNLADESRSSAEEIGAVIARIAEDTAHAVESMLETEEEMGRCLSAISTAGVSFQHIQQSVTDVAHQIQEVSNASKELADQSALTRTSIHAISDATSSTAESTKQIAAASQEQLAAMEQVTASAGQLSDMATHMQQLVTKFTL